MADEDTILISEQVLQVPYKYSAGPVASRFLVALRDEQKICGLRCQSCGKVYVPPRGTCGTCFEKLEEWVEVGPEGELLNFTAIHYPEPVHPEAAPFVLGIIRLDGADTGLLHLVRAPLDKVKIGMRLKPVFCAERRGHILDLKGFEPAD